MHSRKSLINQWLEKAEEKEIPLQVSLELTHKCNLQCHHCYLDQDEKQTELSKLEWKLIIDQLREAGTLYLFLMGGEAILHRDFYDILKYSSRKGFFVSLITNGTLLQTKEEWEKLIHHGLHHVTISLLSLKEDTHDQLTQSKGSWQKTMRAIELAEANKIPIGINLLLTKVNIDEYFDILSWCNHHDFELNSDPLMTCKLSGELSNTKLRPTLDQIKWYYEERIKKWPESIHQPETLMPDDPLCNMARIKAAVTPEGDLIPCIEIREVIGNLLKEKIHDIWDNTIAKKWRNFTVKDLKQNYNELLPFCDLCPGMGLNECKSPLVIPSFVLDVAAIKRALYKKYEK